MGEVGTGTGKVPDIETDKMRGTGTGIVSYGVYVPIFRIAPKDIGTVWGVDGASMGKSFGIESKSVPGPDEDVVTMAVAAARAAVRRSLIDPHDIGAVYVGSESHPYAVKPTASIVAEAIEATPHLTAADFEFACKAGTAGMQACIGMVASGLIKYGLAIGSDTSQGAPGDPLEYSASAGAAAFIISRDNQIATINKTISYTTDTPDFWRRDGQHYPSHGGRFTGEPAYFKHIQACAKKLMADMGTSPTDYQHAVFHQPNGKFPVRVAKLLEFTPVQIKNGLLTPVIGNTYSAAVPLGLASVLDSANPGDRILVIAYGSGAGADGFDITVTDNISVFHRNNGYAVSAIIGNGSFIDYATYAKYRKKILMREDSE